MTIATPGLPPMPRLVAAWLHALVCALACWGAPLHAQTGGGSEAQVKAAFLFRFPGFVDWLHASFRSADAPFVIGVAGADAVVLEVLSLTHGMRLLGRPVELRRISLPGLPAEPPPLFIGADSARDAPALLARLWDRPVLAVTGAGWGLPSGAMLNLVLREGRVRFEAAPPAAERFGRRFSARLLAVADKVWEGRA